MIQLELYVNGVDLPERLLSTVFNFVTLEHKEGWRLLRHKDNHDFMLFDPGLVKDGVTHWPEIKRGAGGAGIEIVIIVEDAVTFSPSSGQFELEPFG